MTRWTALLLLTALGWCSTAVAQPTGWKLVKRGELAQPGELAIVGSIVVRPNQVGIRVRGSGTVTVRVVMSCRKGIATRIGRGQLSGSAPYVRAVSLPLAGASNCAVSATGTSTAGALRLELLRS